MAKRKAKEENLIENDSDIVEKVDFASLAEKCPAFQP